MKKTTLPSHDAFAERRQISAAQIRAGRHLAGLSQRDVVKETGLPLLTVRRAESERIVPVSPDAIAAIRAALEAAGLQFTNGARPSVRLKEKGPKPRESWSVP